MGGGLLNKHNSLKLQKFKENNNKRKVIVTAIIISILLLSGIYLYSSFAVFSEEKNFNVINGTVSDPGDIYFAYYVDGEITRSIPNKQSNYTLDIEKSNCTNGVAVDWNDDTWTALINYENYNATDYTRTKCNLYFKVKISSAVDKITKLSNTDTTNLATDDYRNIRYIGADPNNYVSIDGETWRIIGVFNNIKSSALDEHGETRIKLIRNESIGEYSWDTSDSTTNNGYGVNEWSFADLMKLLNPGYENEGVGGSLYWNSKSGMCYVDKKNVTESCDFTNIGIKSSLINLIDNAVWNTGSPGTNLWTDASGGLARHFYAYERSENTGKICIGGTYCNDTVTRTTKWIGKVGLMYVSDNGYATSGGSITSRDSCLESYLTSWDNSNIIDCKNNSWLHTKMFQWTLTPSADSNSATVVFSAGSNNGTNCTNSYCRNAIYPAVYLKSSVKIVSGTGTDEDPFVLGK